MNLKTTKYETKHYHYAKLLSQEAYEETEGKQKTAEIQKNREILQKLN